jgi:hypothetical protein
MRQDEIEAVLAGATAKPRRWRADALGKLLGLTDTQRTELKITTIGACDVTKAERMKRRRERARQRQAAKRQAASVSRAQYLAACAAKPKPWLLLGLSRATWYRRHDAARPK